ncbi:MAG: hypothetical protein IKW08_05720 [Roseburia sp.]|nr:hypothetical protein [Roseburia sp.]
MTKKLYYEDAYATGFEAVVVSCEEKAIEDKAVKEQIEGAETVVYQVVLDQTLFFPEEGGQSPDKGVIGTANVLDVQIKNDIITHIVDKPFCVGETVRGMIDWKHRFSNMQQHSGEHIFSGTVNRLYGYDNVGFHLSDNIVTMDFNGVLTEEDVVRVEELVNEAIVKNLPIIVTYPTKEELANMEYRSKIEILGQVRIVNVEGVDVCACCAPHVKRTGEIGMLKVMSVQNHRGGVRISMLCGFRALEAFREKSAIITKLMDSLTVSQELLPDRVEKLKASNQDYKYRLAMSKQKLLEIKMTEIPNEQENVFLFEQDIESTVMRNVVNKLTAEHSGVCGVFVGNDEAGYSFIIGSVNVDCTQIGMLLREKTGAKCGGKKPMIQGSVQASEEILKAVLLDF